MYELYFFLKDLADRRPWKSEDGVTALEYGLIASLIAVVIITAVSLLGTNLSAMFSGVAGKITAPT